MYNMSNNPNGGQFIWFAFRQSMLGRFYDTVQANLGNNTQYYFDPPRTDSTRSSCGQLRATKLLYLHLRVLTHVQQQQQQQQQLLLLLLARASS
jgi:hypothetical protein